jgi:hypothetical protein
VDSICDFNGKSIIATSGLPSIGHGLLSNVVTTIPNVSETQLCPAQQAAFEYLSAGVQVGSILRLHAGPGRGKTTVLRQLHKQVGGAFLNMKDFIEASAGNHPLALEETLYRLLLDALQAHPVVIMDDIHLVHLGAGCHFYPRSGSSTRS